MIYNGMFRHVPIRKKKGQKCVKNYFHMLGIQLPQMERSRDYKLNCTKGSSFNRKPNDELLDPEHNALGSQL